MAPTDPQQSSYKPLLQESIHHLLLQLCGGASDLSHFHLIFSRLLQTTPSPPLEIIWFYGALHYHDHHHDHPTIALKHLFHSLLASSDSPSTPPLKRVAALAPLLFQLHNLVRQGSTFDADVASLLERVVSFISMCCCSSGVVAPHHHPHGDDGSPAALSSCFPDLVRVWTFDRRHPQQKQTECDCFKVFFPAVSDEVLDRVTQGCGVAHLAGLVIFHCFFLRLSLELRSRPPPHKDSVKILATEMLSGFRSCYFFDILMEMLLEPTISITCLSSRDDEVILRKILFDAIITIDYPFSHPESEMHVCNNHLKGLALSWLFVAENALSFMREHLNASQADAYAGAFFKSVSQSWLMGWLINKLRIEEIIIQRISSSPAALFDWISELHNQTSDPDISKLVKKVARCRSRPNSNLPMLQLGGQNKECDNDLCTNDYMVHGTDISMGGFNSCSEAHDRGRKRKDVTTDGETGLQLKMLKYQFCEDSFNRALPFHNGSGWVRKNEMESPAHDDDMEITVQ